MTHDRQRNMGLTCSVLWIVGSVAGCQAPTDPPASPEPPKATTVRAGDSKAHLTLERIEPSVSRPTAGPNVPPLSDRAQQQILKARSLLADQRFTEAAIELERALRSDPNHPAVHAVLAVLHLQAGNLDRARNHASKSLESNSDSAAVHYVLGRCKMKAGEAAGALYELRTAAVCSDFQQDLELAALCRYHLAELLAGEGYNTAALSQYDEFEQTAAQLRNHTAGHAFSTELSGILGSPALLAESRARLLAGLGRYEEAGQMLATVVASRPGDTALAVQHAELLMHAGRLDEAYQAVQKIAANDEAVITLIHEICRRAGDPQRAVTALKERLAASPDDAGLVLRFSETLEKQGALDQAGAALEGFLRDHASASAVRTRLIELRVKQNDWPAAVGLAADAIGVSPASAGQIAETLLSAASRPEGVEAMLAVAERGNRCSDSYLAGVLAAKAGNTDRAVEHLKRAIETAADFTAARVALGQIYFDQYRYDDALKTIPADQSPTVADAQLLLARVYDRLDDLSRADQHYRAAIQLDRDNEDSKFALAELYFRGGETEQAQRQVNLLLQQNPDHERARELLGMIYWNEKKADLFIGEFRELAKRTSRATTAARCRIMTDETLRANPPEARKILLAAMEEGEPDARTWLAVVATYEPDELAEQRQGYLNALAMEPNNEDALLGLSWVDQFDLRFESAVTQLEELIHRRPNRHDWRQRLIKLKLVLQSFDAAMELAKPQLEREELDPRERIEYRGLYLQALAWAKRADELEAQLRQWMEADPAERQWPARLVDHRLAKKDFAGAIDVCEQLYTNNQEDPLARAWLITVMIAGKDYAAATEHCLDWLHRLPDDDQYTRLLATVLAESHELDAALDLVRSRLVRTSDRETYQNWMLDNLSRADRHEEAVELAQILLDTAVQALREVADRGPAALNEPREESEWIQLPNGPAHPEKLHRRIEILRRRLVSVLIAARSYRRAEDLLDGWLNESSDPAARYNYLRLLAVVHQMEGLDQKAASVMERALLLQPIDVGLNNDLAYVWIDRGVRLKEAEPLIRHALGNAPDQAAYLDTYGWLLYKKGDFAGAHTWLIRANTARGEEDPVILDHLGDSLWRLGRRDDAQSYWKQAVDLVKERDADDLSNPDERRVKATTPAKIEAAKSDAEPAIAPLAEPGDAASNGGTERT